MERVYPQGQERGTFWGNELRPQRQVEAKKKAVICFANFAGKPAGVEQ